MNPRDAVLRNWDILQVIMTFVKGKFTWKFGRGSGRDIMALALVCRTLSHLALDVLWRHVNLENINCLFPTDMIRVYLGGTKTLTRIAAAPQEWERFDVYAPRIRKLSASPYLNDLLLQSVGGRHPIELHPFPNLTYLEWSSDPSEIVDVTPLICPTLTKVRLFIEEPSADEDDDGTVAEILQNLGEICARLRKLIYCHFPTPHNQSKSKSVEATLIYLIRQCRRLEYVHLPVSRDILHALGSLPHLSTLQLEYVEWEDESQSHLPIQAEEWIEETDKFPVLENLNIQGSHTVSSLTECFQDSGCFPKKSLIMDDISEHEQWSTVAIAEFLRGILRPDRNEGLGVLWIDRPADEENPVGHDPWQALRCLSFFPNLQALSLYGLFLDINDTDLEEIPRIWPKLHSLTLHVPCIHDYQSQISFQGLAHLSELKNLKYVSLMLAPESTISESMLSPSTSSSSQLASLTIRGRFPPVTPNAAAIFLILHFLQLESIHPSLDSDEGEKERIKEIQVLLDAERPRMENLRAELRNCGSGTEAEQESGAD